MMLGKLIAPGRPTNFDNSRARPYCACSRCGLSLFWTFCFFSSIFSFTLFEKRPDIDRNIVTKGR